MKNLLNKNFLIGLLITVVAIIITSFDEVKPLFYPKEAVLGEVEQVITQDEVKPEAVVENYYTERTEELQVPLFWEYKIISDDGSNNAIHGYIPDLKEYLTWYEYVYDKINIVEGFEDLEKSLYEDIRITKGLRNNSQEYSYTKNNCTEISLKGKNIVVCLKWISLSNKEVSNKDYVLVRCSQFDKQNRKGYCLFEDYRVLYYNYNRDFDTECLDDEQINLYCDLEKYLDIL